jgi:hypothetical protein
MIKKDKGEVIAGHQELCSKNINAAMLETNDNRHEVSGKPVGPMVGFNKIGEYRDESRYELEGDNS